VIVTRPGQGVEQMVAPDSASSKVSDKPWFRKQDATLANFILCCQKTFRAKRFVIKIHAYLYRWSANFWL